MVLVTTWKNPILAPLEKILTTPMLPDVKSYKFLREICIICAAASGYAFLFTNLHKNVVTYLTKNNI